jgi:hypothetical protein
VAAAEADGEGEAVEAAGIEVDAAAGDTLPAPDGALLAGAAPSVLLPQATRTSTAARSANAFVDVIVPPQVAVDFRVGRLDGRGASMERNGVLVPRFTIGG